MAQQRNVLGTPLETCSIDPRTGFYRDGCCQTGTEDFGQHTVCAQMTPEFLAFSKAAGNDLSTPSAGAAFPGLKPGDQWCVCLSRWQDAHAAGVAPPIRLAATHQATLEKVPLEVLKQYAIDFEAN